MLESLTIMKHYTRFIKLILPHGKIFSLAVIAMIGSTLFSASPIALIIPFVDIIISGKKIPIPEGVPVPEFLVTLIQKMNTMPVLTLFTYMAILVFVFFLFKGVFDFFRMYLMSDVSQRVIRDVKNDIYGKLQGLSMEFYSNKPTGELMSRITYDSAIIRDAISSGIADSFYQPIQIIVYSAMVVGCKLYFNIPWKLIWISLVLFPIVIIPVVMIGKKLRKISRDSQEKVGDINNLLLETISGMKLVKSFGMENYELNRFKKHNQEFYKLNMKSIKRMKIISPLTESMIVGCSVVIMLVVGKSIVSGEMSIGAFGAFLAAIFSMQKPIKKLSNVYGINQQALAASERIFSLMDEHVTVKEAKDPIKLNTFEKEIKFKDIFFAYDKDMIIKGINLTVKKGEIVALVGPSGGGKSTLVNLIPRFYDPNKGTVEIDGINLNDICVKSLREKIGLVTQETLLFNDTVKNNICYGHEDADEEQLVKVAKAANAHRFIKDFPDGYNTEIGERGLKVSGGQRQRIAIARAVYKNPPILIFDEATSQLDTESEKLVQEAINNLMKGRTTIVIAHRLSTIQHADKIAVVDNGKIVEMGPHAQLLEKSPLYKRLYEMQFADDVKEVLENIE